MMHFFFPSSFSTLFEQSSPIFFGNGIFLSSQSQTIALSGIYQYIIYPTLPYVNVRVRIPFHFFSFFVNSPPIKVLFLVSSIPLLPSLQHIEIRIEAYDKHNQSHPSPQPPAPSSSTHARPVATHVSYHAYPFQPPHMEPTPPSALRITQQAPTHTRPCPITHWQYSTVPTPFKLQRTLPTSSTPRRPHPRFLS